MTACIASICEVSIEDAPYLKVEQWFGVLWNWLEAHGYEIKGLIYGTDILEYDVGVDGYYVVCGRSREYVQMEKVTHSVVFYRGRMVHDPNPSGRGLYTIDYGYRIERAKNTLQIK